MEGSFTYADKTYTWWAGPADTESEWCVHCRNASYGLTRYLPNEIDREEAEQVAQRLAPSVESIISDAYSG